MSAQPLAPILVRGGIAVAAGAAASRVVQLAGWIALARLLAPADFGAVAVAAIFVNALALLPGLGLGTALAARSEEPRRLAPAALTASLLAGGVLAAVATGAGELLARSRGAEVGRVVALLGFSLLFQGAGSVAAAVLDRELRFRARAASDVAGSIAFVAVALIAVRLGLRADAPALGLVAASAVTAGANCVAARLAPARRPDFAALRATARTGAVVLATSLLQWLFVSADIWIVEQRFGREAVGCYGVALQLALAPATFLGLLSSRLALPAFAQARARGAPGGAAFERTSRAVVLIAGIATALLALAAGPLVRALYGERFAAAGALVPPLALYAFARVLGSLGGPALLAAGRARTALWLILLQNGAAIPTAWLLPDGLGARGTALVFALATAAAGLAALRLGTRALRSELPGPRAALAADGGGEFP